MPEVTNRLGVCPATVYNLVKRKQLPAPAKIGAASVWPEQVIEDYLQQQFNAANPASQPTSSSS